MRSMSSSGGLLRWLCWALVVLVIISAVVTVAITQNLLVKFPDLPPTMDFVDRVLAVRGYDQQVNTLALVGSLAGVGVFLVAAMLGTTLRAFARPVAARDTMAVVFVVGGIIGVAAQLVNIGVNQFATYGYCDCGYRTEEVIAQAYALDLGWTMQQWLALAAVTLVGVGAALAGWLVEISPSWRLLSYLIAIALLLAVGLRLIGQDQFSDLLTAITSGIAVPIWAILLARGAGKAGDTAAVAAA